MRRVGFIGLGKLGLPCAAALSVEAKTEVIGYDLNTEIARYIKDCKVPYLEEGIELYLRNANIRFASNVEEVILKTDLVFLAIQTPHEEMYEGNTPTPVDRKDFNYEYLLESVRQIVKVLESFPEKELTLVVISTVLPGTMRRLVKPILEKVKLRINFCYNPFFIAMGTTIHDFLNPEFVLIGQDNPDESALLKDLYKDFITCPIREMEIESAELTKVAYNTFIGFKIVFANTIGEICAKAGGNPDEVTQALSAATNRLMSKKYLSPGMADGGGCHPRDQIAMSFLAQSLSLSVDPFTWLANARDSQTKRQAEIIKQYAQENPTLKVVILGEAYKADINLTIGSPSRLLQHYLRELELQFTVFDPYVYPARCLEETPSLFFVATNHRSFYDLKYPKDSILLDPWGNTIDSMIQDSTVKIVLLGRQKESNH